MTTNAAFPPWQQKAWDLLSSYIRQARIPQALLITGAIGTGKQAMADQFANALLCANRSGDYFACGQCDSCLLIKAATHPDLIRIRPEEDKASISVNQVRQFVADTYLKPQFESHRVIIVNPADTMTTSAANAFLKCLEEPTERTLFLLISAKPHKLPATIRSRCQTLALSFPETPVLADWLQSQGMPASLAGLVKSGIMQLPQLADPDILRQRSDCFRDWLGVARHKNQPALVAEKWLKLPETDLINWLLSWLGDVVKCASNTSPTHLCNQDFGKPLQELAQRLELKGLYLLYDHLLACRQQVGAQLNFQMLLEEILVQWQGLNGRT